MNEDRLGKYIQQGKAEANAFFSHVEEDVLRAAVRHKLEAPRRKAVSRLILRVGAVAACAVVAVCVWLNAAPRPGEEVQALPAAKNDGVSAPMAEQPVSMGTGDDYKLSFHPVSTPNTPEPGLMSILWQQAGGRAEMIYSNLFEESDSPYPASVVGFPGDTQDKMLLLSSGSSTQSYMHYRVLRYSGGSFDTVWSQDYVPQGKLGVQDGVVVEQRQGETQNAQFSYIIPYRVDTAGDVFLPVEALHLHVGDQVLLVSADGGYVRAEAENGMAEHKERREGSVVDVFVAGTSGVDQLFLQGEQSGKALSLEITE